MLIIKNPFIKLKEYLDEKDYKDIRSLEEICLKNDDTSLKLEIEYKRKMALEKTGIIHQLNEFMYYDNEVLIGYIGICDFGGDTIEVNGMVHPEYRRQAIFKKLYSFVETEWLNRDSRRILLLSDQQSVSGLEFIKTTNAFHEHSEYEMYLTGNLREYDLNNVILRKATNDDAKEIAVQNSIYFNDELPEENEENKKDLIMPEDEEQRGFIIYMAEVNDKIIGKVHIEIQKDIGGIYGLGVLPEYRGRGYGREILIHSIIKLKENKLKNIMLQVVTKNENALNLYRSCGFETKSVMDYYVISK